MQQESPIEQRVFVLENRLAELEAHIAKRERDQSNLDVALLQRIDSFIADLHRVERDQRSSFDELKAGQSNLRTEFRASQEYATERFDTVETDVTVLIDAAKDHKQAIEGLAGQVNELAAGQQQILTILLGKPPRND